MGNSVAEWKRPALGLSLAVAVLCPTIALADCAPGTVELRSPTGAVARFTVEIADDEPERAQGLMNRAQMASGAGMLFVYETPRHAFFWMKNTLIPLDMLFADATGQVTVVHDRAIPLDETAIDGGEDVRFVLEINGGLASALGLGRGTLMRAPQIDQATAAWPCGQ